MIESIQATKEWEKKLKGINPFMVMKRERALEKHKKGSSLTIVETREKIKLLK